MALGMDLIIPYKIKRGEVGGDYELKLDPWQHFANDFSLKKKHKCLLTFKWKSRPVFSFCVWEFFLLLFSTDSWLQQPWNIKETSIYVT